MLVQRLAFEVQGSKFKAQSSRFKIQIIEQMQDAGQIIMQFVSGCKTGCPDSLESWFLVL